MAPDKMAETNQVRCKAIWVEPPRLPKGPYGTKRKGRRPSAKAKRAPMTEPSGKTRCKRGDNAPGSNNETDAKKRRRPRPGHSQRASAKPTAEADKATTKKERGKEWVSDSDRASNRETNAKKSDRPQKGKDQAEREELSLTGSHREGNSKRTGSPRVPGEPTGRGGSLTRRIILQA